MGKARDLFKKIREYQGNISCKDGHNKGQKCYGPNRSRRDQEEMAKIHRNIQKYLNDPDNHDDVLTHLEPDILECEIKWGLGSIITEQS